jgi:hypothetical protein
MTLTTALPSASFDASMLMGQWNLIAFDEADFVDGAYHPTESGG